MAMIDNYILYGDDNEKIGLDVAGFLKEKGYNVDLVSSPKEFTSRARLGKYNAVVSDLDYSPQGAEGYDAIKEIRDIPSFKVIFTGRAGFEHAAEGFECGADRVVLSKNLGRLLDVLEKELNSGGEDGR
jgi:DNA-binding response OmpR family regulator